MPYPPWTHAHAAHTRRARAEPLLQASHALLTPLRKPNVQRLAADHLQVHLRHSLRRLLRGGEAHETEALGRALVIADNLGRRDLAEGAEVLAELLVVDALVEVLDVEVHALLRAGRGALRVELLRELELALGLGLRAADVELAAVELVLLVLRLLLR